MGVLRDHDLASYIAKGYTILAETGTGTGTAVSHALGFPFKAIYSCDIDAEQIWLMQARYRHDERVHLFPLRSDDYIRALLEDKVGNPPIKTDDRVLWFLDSHFPGFDLYKAAIDAEKNLDVRLPLQTELNLLLSYGRTHDVIIADDLRIFEKGPFASRNMDQIGYGYAAAYDRPLDLSGWEKTHTIVRDYRDTGYMILTPLNS